MANNAMKNRSVFLGAIALIALTAFSAHATDAPEPEARGQMIEVIEAHARDAGPAVGRGAIAPTVLDAMRRVAREAFVPRSLRPLAYADRPLPIRHGQTISQPYIVALMSDLLDIEPGDTVLEIGTGSGYQAAVLAALDTAVYSIEIIPELADSARAVLDEQGYGAVESRTGDGYYGWPEAAPFDGIVVTAAASHVPPPLVRQLKPGGRMVVPVGSAFSVQQLMLVEVDADGHVRTRQLLPVRFVPLTGAH